MSYIDNNLVKGEEVIYRTGLHWWTVVSGALKTLLILGVPTIWVASNEDTSAALCISLMIILIPLNLIGGYINYVSSEFGLTNRRVLIKTGLIRRQTLELNLDKIESFQVRDSILGRILGFNNLTVTGSGGTKQRFRAVRNGDIFRRRVTEYSTSQ